MRAKKTESLFLFLPIFALFPLSLFLKSFCNANLFEVYPERISLLLPLCICFLPLNEFFLFSFNSHDASPFNGSLSRFLFVPWAMWTSTLQPKGGCPIMLLLLAPQPPYEIRGSFHLLIQSNYNIDCTWIIIIQIKKWHNDECWRVQAPWPLSKSLGLFIKPIFFIITFLFKTRLNKKEKGIFYHHFSFLKQNLTKRKKVKIS